MSNTSARRPRANFADHEEKKKAPVMCKQCYVIGNYKQCFFPSDQPVCNYCMSLKPEEVVYPCSRSSVKTMNGWMARARAQTPAQAQAGAASSSTSEQQ